MATIAVTRELPAYRNAVLEWLTTTDHKKIGIMYLANSFTFFLLGGLAALAIRSELAQAGEQFLGPDRYNQIFTMHGTIMIFLFIIPILVGFGNYMVPI